MFRIVMSEKIDNQWNEYKTMAYGDNDEDGKHLYRYLRHDTEKVRIMLFLNEKPKPARIVVDMFGCCVESVSSETPTEVIFIDTQTDLYDSDCVQTIEGEDMAVISVPETEVRPPYVDSIFKQVKEVI